MGSRSKRRCSLSTRPSREARRRSESRAPEGGAALVQTTGEGVSRRFVEEYLLMLPTRAAKIFNCLTGTDPEPANKALIILRVTSAMAGALRLRTFCYDLKRALNAEKARLRSR